MRYVTARQLARLLDLGFGYVPFERSFHRPDVDWEGFLGFGELAPVTDPNSLPARSMRLPEIDLTSNRWLQLALLRFITRRVPPRSSLRFVLSPFSSAPPEQDPEFAAALFAELRAHYWQRRRRDPVAVFARPGKVHVAVVVRRGELESFRASAGAAERRVSRWRWVELDWYVAVLARLHAELGAENVECHVFSDAKDPSSIAALRSFAGSVLHLDHEPRQPLELFHAIVEADVVVCGVTGICYAAGVLGEGLMVLPPNDAQAVHFPVGGRWFPFCHPGDGTHDELGAALRALRVRRGKGGSPP